VALAVFAASAAQAQQSPAAEPAAAAAPAATPASAPTPATEPRARESTAATSLQTVTISGTRRKELVREVPLAVTSVSTEQLQETGARSINDYLAAVPGVVLQNSGVIDGTGNIIIRGLTLGSDANSPTSVYLDDVPLARGSSFNLNLLDLSRFEVLRGPQGTLYGSSAIGGIVKYTSVQPDDGGFEGRATLGLSHTGNGGTNTLLGGVLNAPLQKGVAALRVAVFGTDDKGWVDTLGPSTVKGVNSSQSQGARLSGLLKPVAGLSVTATAMTQTTDTDGSRRVPYDPVTHEPTNGDLVFSPLGMREPTRSKRDLYSLTVEYDLRWARFTSVTARQKMRDDARTDFQVYAPLFGATQAYSDSSIEQTKTTQEFRLVSQGTGPLQWLVGYFHDKLALKQASNDTIEFGPTKTPFQNRSGTRDYSEDSVYGTVTWDATTNLALTGGLRLARYEQTDAAQSTPPPQSNRISFSENARTYLLAARLRLTPTSNVYARAANGYRPGGANYTAQDATGQPIPGAPLSYGTDDAWTYEIGYKGQLSPTLAVEATVFRTDWKDLQQFTTIPGLGSLGFTSNLGKARIDGIEAGAVWQATRDLSLNASLSLLDPKLLTDSAGLQASAGDRLPNSPKTAAALGARYSFDAAGMPAFAALNLTHVGARTTGFPKASNYYRLPAYTQADVSAGVRIGRFDVNGYVRNLSDARGQLGAAVAPGLPAYVQLVEPRTVGVTLSANF
jgi:outer membrane receptor protein involved in Fe transport